MLNHSACKERNGDWRSAATGKVSEGRFHLITYHKLNGCVYYFINELWYGAD